MAGAPLGNKNGAKKRLPWQQALKRALTRYAADAGEEKPNYRRGLDRVAMEVVRQAVDGQKEAWQELGNRLEGRPAQSMKVSGDAANPIHTVNRIERVIVDGNTPDSDS